MNRPTKTSRNKANVSRETKRQLMFGQLQSILVFAPHPDDETLACGGTIILEARAGSSVHIVIMTDGRNSHKTTPDTYPKPSQDEIAKIRHDEALRAAGLLGVEKERVTFLDFHDGTLKDNITASAEKAGQVILKLHPDKIYLPSAGDIHRDHRAANAILLEAARTLKISAEIYEYTVWREEREAGEKSAAAGSIEVNISKVLDDKLKAINAYQSQTGNMLNGKPQIPVLNRQFLARFKQPAEYFRKYKIIGGKVQP